MICIALPCKLYPPQLRLFLSSPKFGFELAYNLEGTPTQTISPNLSCWVTLASSAYMIWLALPIKSYPSTWVVSELTKRLGLSLHTIWKAPPFKLYPPTWVVLSSPQLGIELTYNLASTPEPTISPPLNFGCSGTHQDLGLSPHTIWQALPSKSYPPTWVALSFL